MHISTNLSKLRRKREKSYIKNAWGWNEQKSWYKRIIRLSRYLVSILSSILWFTFPSVMAQFQATTGATVSSHTGCNITSGQPQHTLVQGKSLPTDRNLFTPQAILVYRSSLYTIPIISTSILLRTYLFICESLQFSGLFTLPFIHVCSHIHSTVCWLIIHAPWKSKTGKSSDFKK